MIASDVLLIAALLGFVVVWWVKASATAALRGRGRAVRASALSSQTADFAAWWRAEQPAVLATELRCALVADAVRSR